MQKQRQGPLLLLSSRTQLHGATRSGGVADATARPTCWLSSVRADALLLLFLIPFITFAALVTMQTASPSTASVTAKLPATAGRVYGGQLAGTGVGIQLCWASLCRTS